MIERAEQLPIPEESDPRRTTVFLTNRHQVNEALSRGLVMLRPGYGPDDKYYEDTLDLAPGYLPVFRAGLGGMTDFVSEADDPTNFPVALELDLSNLAIPMVTNGARGSAADDADWTVAALSIPLPLVAVRALHFASERDRQEFEYAVSSPNIPHGILDLAVTPGLFREDSDLSAETTASWLQSLPALDSAGPGDYRLSDAAAGAASMLLATCPLEPKHLSWLVALLNAERPSTTLGVPYWLGALVDPEVSRLAPSDPEIVLTDIVRRVLIDTNPSRSWLPEKILNDVRAAAASATALPENMDEVFRLSLEVLRAEAPLPEFHAGKGLNIAKSLLLLLLDREPDDALAQHRDCAFPPEVSAGHAVLAGYVHGFSRLTADVRGIQQIRHFGSVETLKIAGSRGVDAAVLPWDTRVTCEVKDDAFGATTFLLSTASGPILEKKRPAPSMTDLLIAADLSAPSIRDVAIELSWAMGWDCVRSVIRVPVGRGWRTLVDAEGHLEMEFDTSVELETVLDDARFRAKLAEAELPSDIRDRFTQAVVKALKKRRPAARKH